MSQILSMRELAPTIFEAVVEAPEIAKKAKAGEFLVVMPDEKGERIPLTIADFDRDEGTITIVFMTIGTSTYKLADMKAGDEYFAFVGPLGHSSEIKNHGTVVMVAGGVGTAPIYPIARALKEAGNKVISIQGSRSKELLFWEDKLASVSDEHIWGVPRAGVGHADGPRDDIAHVGHRRRGSFAYVQGRGDNRNVYAGAGSVGPGCDTRS